MMHSKNDRQKATAAAVRFLEAMEELQASLPPNTGTGTDYVYGSPVESGAVRRASMDLTRALAKLRKYSA